MARKWDLEQPTSIDVPSTTPRRQDGSAVPARQRVLNAAARLFYEEGVRAVGVDRVIGEAPVTKTTFYKLFGSRANLVEEYVQLLCVQDRDALAGIVTSAFTARSLIDAVVELVVADVLDPGYRGSALLNAAAAHPNQEHPVRVRIESHDTSQEMVLEAALADTGHGNPRQIAATLTILIVGTHGAATLGNRDNAVSALRTAAGALLVTKESSGAAHI